MVTKNTTPPASSVTAPNLQPSFTHHEAGTQFGFSPFIIPPGTEPDLQALNNPYVAAAREKQALSAGLDNARLVPTAATLANQYLTPVPSRTMLVAHQSDANSDFLQNLEPTLWPISDERLGHPGLQDSGSESSQTSSEGGDGDTDDEEEEEDHVDDRVGWGAAHGRMTTHPGFSKEDIPSQPRVTLTHPTNFDFQHLRNEGDNDMERSLENNISSTDDIANKSSDTKVKTESGQAKEPGDGPKAMQLGWYGPRWKRFLEDTKGEYCAQHAIENPFPKLVKDLTGSVNEVLMASLVEWLEEGIWPDHKHDMAKLLYEDLSTWHSELKKVVAGIMPSMYNLIPPLHVLPEQRATWIEEAAKKLLEDAIFLCYGVDQNGKTNNAAHPDLTILLAGDWMSSGMSYHLNAWHWFALQNGHGKSFPKFSTKEYASLYTVMLAMLKSIMEDPYHGLKLMRQLHSWAESGWVQSYKIDGSLNDNLKHSHLKIILD
ncbi:uncharacterized protein F5147DRAFT_772860 [Suillus discolor]|uniref:DUF6532 domain-containing protein n=1 Tax=Suillus discolor TaxID=1912936 RepID=A0A9P7F988_9AGAM|nr:uncharacterized protein F5147DRAFT_772860 [Suillus discolor]KAG2109552.1 hypothetical protein F5147DRAFT_772860 [Suillus discolor]